MMKDRQQWSNHLFGIDPSLTGTGWAILDHTGEGLIDCGVIKPKKLRGFDRWEFIVDQLMIAWSKSVLRPDAKPRLAFIEGYAFAMTKYGSRTFDLAELGGIIKYRMRKERGVFAVTIATQTAKKAATGKGNAKKDVVNFMLNKRYAGFVGLRQKPLTVDETDAIAVGLAGAAWVMDPANILEAT